MKEVHREQRSLRWQENLLRDARHGLAALARDPRFATVAVGVLAVGIGANVAMFSLVDGTLPLDPSALVLSCAAVMLIGLLASLLPASRATHVDPVTSLRDEG